MASSRPWPRRPDDDAGDAGEARVLAQPKGQFIPPTVLAGLAALNRAKP